MSVHKKLMEARIKLHGMKLKKTGRNSFVGYDYFELSDFLPHVQKIFNELNLFGFITYDKEFARLTIIDTEDSSNIVITSPMADANLKGAHPIQNLGAVETYQRRYLWVTAMEILENDIVDSSAGVSDKKEQPVKKYLVPENKAAWNRAKEIFKKDGNLETVLAHMNVSKEHQMQLMKECENEAAVL